MSFNESWKDEGGRMNEVREPTVPYETSSFSLHPSALRYQYVHGDNLVLYGKQPQNVFGSKTCVNMKTSEVNYV